MNATNFVDWLKINLHKPLKNGEKEINKQLSNFVCWNTYESDKMY